MRRGFSFELGKHPSSAAVKRQCRTRWAIIGGKLTLFFFTVCGTVAAQSPAWVAQGPGPNTRGQVENIANLEVVGAINAVAPHPTDPNTLYVGAVNGGIWKTTNALALSPTWQNQTDFQPSLSIGALEFDPTDSNSQTLVAGIGRFSSFAGRGGALVGLLRTTNGGASWTSIDGGGTLNGLNLSGVAPRGSTIVISANNSGIWRSTDTGATWMQVSGATGTGLPTGISYRLAGDPNNSSRLFTNAGTNGLYRSTDTGATWTKVSSAAMDALITTSTNNIRISVGTSNNIYVCIANSGKLAGVFRSGDGGNTWVPMDLPTTVEGGINPGGQSSTHLSIAADPSNTNLVYIGGDHQPIAAPPSPPFPNSIGARDYSGRLFRGDASQPSGSQWVHLTHSNSLGAAGGGTADSSAPHADSRDMKVASNGVLFEGDDGGIYRRTNPQTNAGDWFSANGNIQTTEFHSVAWDANSHIIVGGAQDTGTPQQLLTSNVRWQSVATSDGGVVAVDDSGTPGFSTRYSSFYNFLTFRRQVYDASNTFMSQVLPALTVLAGGAALQPQFYTPVKLNAVTPNRLIIGGLNSVYESLDQGDTIKEIGPGITVNDSGSNPIAYGATGNPDMLYVGSVARVFVRTAASPAALTASSAYPGSRNVLAIAIDPDSPLTAYVLDDSNVYRTPDAGATWATITGNLLTLNPGALRTIAYDATDRAVAVGSDLGVFWAPGPVFTTWTSLGTGLPNVPSYRLDYNDADGTLVAGTLGRGAWTLNLRAPRDLCVPNVGGLAGTPTLDGIVSGDAGWNNALQLNLSGDLGSTTATKMLLGSSGGFVYLGQTVTAPVVDPKTTVVLVVSPDGNPADDWRFHIQPFDSTLANAPVPSVVTWWRNSATWNSGASGSIAGATDWEKANMKFSKTGSGHWELEFQIPVATTAGASTGICFNCGTAGLFKMYVNVMNTTSTGAVSGVPPAVSQDVWPACLANTQCGSIIGNGSITQSTPSSRSWGAASLGSRAACTGVSLAWNQVGVQDPINPSNIVQQIRRFGSVTETTMAQCQALADNANPTSNGPANIFLAEPSNNMSTQAQVSVGFRLANWGIPGAIDFSYLGSPLCASPGTSNCTGVSSNPTAASPISASSAGNFNSTTWSLNYKQSCFYKFQEHQCIQVEMDSDDPNTRFLNRSVQRNMDFVPASTFRRTAYISGDQGPLAAGQTKHHFLLMVDTDQQGQVFPTQDWETGRKGGRTFTMRDQELAALAKRQFPDQVTNLLAWILRGYVYTGNKIIINGLEYEWVRRVGDFGYVVGHAGPIAGWNVEIKNPELQKAAKDLYALEVAPGHEAPVETVVTPQEQPTAYKLAWFTQLGANFPHGGLSNTFNPGFSLNSGVEYGVTNQFSLVGIFGYHRLEAAAGTTDMNLFQFSGSGKFYVGSGPLRAFVNGGAGVYHFGQSGVTRPGVNAGGGLQYSVSARIAVEGAYNLHSVFTMGTNTRFSTVQGGVRIKF